MCETLIKRENPLAQFMHFSQELTNFAAVWNAILTFNQESEISLIGCCFRYLN